MIYYIYNSGNGGIIEPGSIVAGRSALGVVKKLCTKHLFTYEGYIKSVQNFLPIKRKIPIVISNQLMLFSSKSVDAYDNIWINWIMIKKTHVEGDFITFTFDENSQLRIKLSETAYRCNHRKIREIINYKNSLV